MHEKAIGDYVVVGKPSERRHSADIRPLLLRAAATEFTEKGYAGATVSDIAHRADVTPSVLYRHFAGKVDIFTAAVISPLLDALEEFRADWSAQRSRPFDASQLWLVFIDDLYRSFSRHRQGLTAFISAGDQLDPDVMGEIRGTMKTVISEIVLIGQEEARRRQVTVADVDLLIRLVLTLVAGATAFGPLTMADESGDVDEGRLISGICDLTLWGLPMAARETTRSSGGARTVRKSKGGTATS